MESTPEPEVTTTTTTTTVDSCGLELKCMEEEEKPMSKNARKKLLKQQRYEAKKAEKKAMEKEAKKREKERKRREWDEKLGMAATDEERQKLIESRKELRKERMEQRCQEKESKLERLKKARLDGGQKIVIDLEFAHLMNTSQLNSLVQQIMYCYAVNGRCESPAHLFLTGCEGEMQNHLQRLPGYEKWVIDKENRSYIQAFEDQKENLIYLTADSETTLEKLDPKKIYIIGGLVDRNRWKGITLDKAKDQGIQTAKLPIGSYLKMSSSQVLTVNQVLEILLKYLETRNWKASFFQVVPQRKRCGDAESENDHQDIEGEANGERDDLEMKKQCI